VHLDNLLFLLLVAVALLFRWLASKAGQTSKDSEDSERRSTSTPPTPPPIPHAQMETDEERIRKFLEALGQPAGSRPPPPVVHRTDIPPRPIGPVQPPPFPTARNVVTRRVQQVILPKITPPPRPVVEIQERLGPRELRSDTKAPVEAYAIAAESRAEPTRSETSIATLLRSTSGLRNAIILREVFGPPRSLQPFDLVGQNL